MAGDEHERFGKSNHAEAPVCFLREDGSAGALVPLWGNERAHADAPWAALHVACRGDLLLWSGVCKAAGASRSRTAGRHPLLGASVVSGRSGPGPLRPLSQNQIL